MAVRFYETVSDALLQFAVIIAMHKGQFVFCQHRERTTLEIPGGIQPLLMEEATAGVFQAERFPICVSLIGPRHRSKRYVGHD